MIDLIVTNGKVFIWKAEDVKKLRQEHRIMGMLIGSLPKSPSQNSFLGLPLQLMAEEATLLKDKGIGQLLHSPLLTGEAAQEVVERFIADRDINFKEQMILCKEERKHQIREAADKILRGKKQKRMKIQQVANENMPIIENNEEEEKEAFLKAELERVQPIPESACLVQVCTACPWQKNTTEAIWNFPNNEKEKIRYLTFRHFWEKGYYLTSAQKFGGDFLIYKGDPHFCHSCYIAVCVNWEERLDIPSVVVNCRLGTSVKKTVLFCSLDENEHVVCTSVKWMGIN